MTILTDEEIDSVYSRLREDTFEQALRSIDFARAIEAKILEKLRDQEPVAWIFDTNVEALLPHELEIGPFESRPELYTPLYANPIPQDDVLKDAERYRWLRDTDQDFSDSFIEKLASGGKRLEKALDIAMGEKK